MRLFGHKLTVSAQVGLVIIAVNVIAAILAPWVAPYSQADIVGSAYFGMLAPAGTPPEIVTKLHDAVVRVCATDAIKKQLLDFGYDIVTNTPAEYEKYLHDEVNRWTPVVKAAGIKIE